MKEYGIGASSLSCLQFAVKTAMVQLFHDANSVASTVTGNLVAKGFSELRPMTSCCVAGALPASANHRVQ